MVTEEESHELLYRGNHVGNHKFRGWELTAAEVIDGENYVLWSHENGKLNQWQCDESWNRIGGSTIKQGADNYEQTLSDFEIVV